MIKYDICDKCSLKSLHEEYDKLYADYLRVSSVNKTLSFISVGLFVLVVLLIGLYVL